VAPERTYPAELTMSHSILRLILSRRLRQFDREKIPPRWRGLVAKLIADARRWRSRASTPPVRRCIAFNYPGTRLSNSTLSVLNDEPYAPGRPD
jgi:hypothetical protein